MFVRICTGILSSFYLLGHVRVSLSYIAFVALIPRYCVFVIAYCVACLHKKCCTMYILVHAHVYFIRAVGTTAENGKRLRFIYFSALLRLQLAKRVEEK